MAFTFTNKKVGCGVFVRINTIYREITIWGLNHAESKYHIITNHFINTSSVFWGSKLISIIQTMLPVCCNFSVWII